jgi:ribosomal protein L32
MAVPKKKMSKAKKNMRKTIWKKNVSKQVTRALFLAKYILRKNSEETSERELNSTIISTKDTPPN